MEELQKKLFESQVHQDIQDDACPRGWRWTVEISRLWARVRLQRRVNDLVILFSHVDAKFQQKGQRKEARYECNCQAGAGRSRWGPNQIVVHNGATMLHTPSEPAKDSMAITDRSKNSVTCVVGLTRAHWIFTQNNIPSTRWVTLYNRIYESTMQYPNLKCMHQSTAPVWSWTSYFKWQLGGHTWNRPLGVRKRTSGGL